MAKPAKVKKASTANPRSRASKRATSPSINLDKSITQAPRASDSTPVLGARPHSGITKSKKKSKPLTRGQRRRHEKGLVMAEVVQDRLARKVDDAAGRLKKRRERKGMWDEVNGGANKFVTLKNLGEGAVGEEEWVDEAMNQSEETAGFKAVDAVNVPVMAETKLVVVDRTAAPSTAAEDEVDKIT